MCRPSCARNNWKSFAKFGLLTRSLPAAGPARPRQLEELGICTYLHVPSPGLLASFLADGARKFIFEGRECGGHVGPRSSFTLWQSAIDVLLDADLAKPEEVHVVFAGGIHDALSAAMVAVLAAPLVARGMKIGVLMGTAYLFTAEGVASGAITEEFQRQALECRETILLESGVGHATRCVPSPFADEFLSAKHELVRDGAEQRRNPHAARNAQHRPASRWRPRGSIASRRPSPAARASCTRSTPPRSATRGCS